MQLMTYVLKYPIQCCKVISRKNTQSYLPQNYDIIPLMQWIKDMTIQFDSLFDIQLQTRVYCIVHNITSINQFPKCKTCDKPIIQNANSFKNGFVQVLYCSSKCRANNPEFKKRVLNDRLSKYGNIFGDPKKIVATRIARHGVKNPKISISLQRAYKEHKNEIQKKKEKTLLKNYGVTSPMLSSELRSRQNVRIKYDGKKFDSLAELAFYIWLTENYIPFDFQTKTGFSYDFNGKNHTYFPDFKVGDIYFEIKGDHFFKEDGTMQNPFDHSQDKLYEAKHQCMLKNNVVILRSTEYKMFELYVEQKYGCKYLKQFKIQKTTSK